MHLTIPQLSARFGEMVLQYRLGKKYSQEVVSEMLHISPRSLSALENGHSLCNSIALLRFLDLLDPDEQNKLIHELTVIIEAFFEHHSDCA